MPYHMQPSTCAMPTMRIIIFKMSATMMSLSEQMRSVMMVMTCWMRTRRSKRTIRTMRKMREALPIRSASTPCVDSVTMISSQSNDTIVMSRANQVCKYRRMIGLNRSSMLPSIVMYPVIRDAGISRVQKMRVTHSMILVKRFSGGSSCCRGIMTMSYATNKRLMKSQKPRFPELGDMAICVGIMCKVFWDQSKACMNWKDFLPAGSSSSSLVCPLRRKLGCDLYERLCVPNVMAADLRKFQTGRT
mmetsp:Transcript_145037/g.270373  ORF Transcript_145037/g.270373 Transcript_145037/m.270373 type:complete len:246 (-) Transcript_145037:872-1609(-)